MTSCTSSVSPLIVLVRYSAYLSLVFHSNFTFGFWLVSIIISSVRAHFIFRISHEASKNKWDVLAEQPLFIYFPRLHLPLSSTHHLTCFNLFRFILSGLVLKRSGYQDSVCCAVWQYGFNSFRQKKIIKYSKNTLSCSLFIRLSLLISIVRFQFHRKSKKTVFHEPRMNRKFNEFRAVIVFSYFL